MHTGSTTFSLGGSAAGSPLPLVDLDCSSNPNYPAAAKGYRIRVTIAGKIGGASGKVVEAGDVVEAVADNAGGTEASVGTSWIVIQANIAGMTAAGLSMITAADAAAQAALLTTLMPKAGGSFTGLTGAGFRDTSAAFDVTMGFTSSSALTAGRELTIDMGNVAHTIALGTTAGTITFPNHAALTVAGLEIANVFTAAQTVPMGTAGAPSINFAGNTTTGWFQRVSGYIMGSINGSERLLFSAGQLMLPSGSVFCFNSQDNTTAGGADAKIARRDAASIGLGDPSASPITQTFGGAQGVGTNIVGGTLNIGTRGTGTGTGGVINFQSHAAGASSSTLGTLVNVLSIISPGVIRITGIPTSSAGLSSGDVYSNAGILTIVA